jgi:hypothetical protein
MRRAAIQQAVSPKMQYNGTGGSLGTEADMRIWGHMYNAFERLAASSAWPRQHEFSQVTNNEASVFHERTLIRAKMFSPHDRLPITWKTPHRDRSSERQLSIPMGRLRPRDTHAADTTRHVLRGGYVHCFATVHRAVPSDAV